MIRDDTARELLRLVSPETARLAKMVSLAVRIEPELIRLARRRFMPWLEAGVEADLWLSPLVQTRSSSAIVLLPQVADDLRRHLAQDQQRLDAAWRLLKEVHATVSPVLSLEEEVIYRSLSGRPSDRVEMDALLQRVAVTMGVQERAQGLARWAARALPGLPDVAQQSNMAQALNLGIANWLGGRLVLDVPERLDPAVSRALSLMSIPDVSSHDDLLEIGVRLVDGGIELGPESMEGAHSIRVTGTSPWVLQISSADERKQPWVIVLESGQRKRVETGPGPVTITTRGGTVYVIRPESIESLTPEFRTETPSPGATTTRIVDRTYRDAVRVRFMPVSQQFVKPTFTPLISAPNLSPHGGSDAGQQGTVSIDDLVDAIGEQKWLLILARAGMGMTSLLQYLTFRLASLRIEETDAPLPIYLDMRDWEWEALGRGAEAEPESFIDFVKRYLSNFTTLDGANSFAARLNDFPKSPELQRRIVLLLDNFQGIPDSPINFRASHGMRMQQILNFAATYPDLAIVIACRKSEYDGALAGAVPRSFSTYEIDRWGEKQISEYFRLNAPELSHFASDTRIHRLADRPVHMVLLIPVLRSAGSEVDDLLDQPRAIVKWHLLESIFDIKRLPKKARAAIDMLLINVAGRLSSSEAILSMIPESELISLAISNVERYDMDPQAALRIVDDATVFEPVEGDFGQRLYGFSTFAFQDYYANAIGGTLLLRKAWAKGLVLRVYFMDGDANQHERVLRIASQWVEGTSLSFKQVQEPEAEIRITLSSPGSWSYLGTDSLVSSVARDQPTMCVGSIIEEPGEEVEIMVLRAFGHALGLVNEPQNPTAYIPWNREAAYKHYANMSRSAVDLNVFGSYDREEVAPKQFDPESIMMWPIPEELTIGNLSFERNKTLSETDRRYIQAVYGPPLEADPQAIVGPEAGGSSSSRRQQARPPARGSRGTVTWLHLSDWQQGKGAFNKKVVRQTMLDGIRARAEISPDLAQVDFVVFSGDIATNGKPEEYQAAVKELFDPLLNAMGLERDRLFVVPGNHDRDRSISRSLPYALRYLPRSIDQFNEWLRDSEAVRSLVSPFAAFDDFAEHYTGQQQAAFASVRTLEINGITIGLLGLNTSLFGYRDEYLVVERQVAEVLDASKDVDIRIAVMHHPPIRMAKPYQDYFDRLSANCHFVLHGHVQTGRTFPAVGTSTEGRKYIVMPAGIVGGTRKQPSMTIYNFVHLDPANSEGTAYVRRWDPVDQMWVGAQELGPQGIFRFALPQDLRTSTSS